MKLGAFSDILHASHPLSSLCNGAADTTHLLHTIYVASDGFKPLSLVEARGLRFIVFLHEGGTWSTNT